MHNTKLKNKEEIMSKTKKSDQSNVQPLWDETQVKKVTSWLKSEEGIKHIQTISQVTHGATAMFNEMIVVNPDQLREPYTI
jgi:hypothetical protein